MSVTNSPSLDRVNKVPSAAMLRARKTQKKGLKFTVMLCGPSGCGKTTFINTLCGREVVSALEQPVIDPQQAHIEPGIEIVPITEDIPDDRNGMLSLKFIDTPGFSDNIDNTESFKTLSDYIEQQFDQVLAEESRIKRNPKFTDNRVDALIYFIAPTGHGLREADVEFMRMMATKVNVIPVLSKADSLTVDELKLNKQLVMQDIDYYNIPVYSFPSDSESEESDEDENEEERAPKQSDGQSELRAMMPFAIIGGTTLMKIKGKSTLVREYPWGVVDITDPKVSDISILSDVLLQSYLMDLKDTTHSFLYENYRTEKLSREPESDGMMMGGGSGNGHATYHNNNNTNNYNGMTSSTSTPNVAAAAAAGGKIDNNFKESNGGGYRSASASYVLREEQLRLEEDKLKTTEMRVQQEIAQKREDLVRREEELRQLEHRLQQEARNLQNQNIEA